MTPPATIRSAALPDSDLEISLGAVEQHLSALGMALCVRDTLGIERHASELHRALAAAVERFAQAARHGSLPPVLRERLASTSGLVAAQRESLARATAALDRAIDVLMPAHGSGLYSHAGGSARGAALGGSVQA
jgi:hypothetical protein